MSERIISLIGRDVNRPLPAEAVTCVFEDDHEYAGISCHEAGRHVSKWCDGCLHERESRDFTRIQLFGPANAVEAAWFEAKVQEVLGELDKTFPEEGSTDWSAIFPEQPKALTAQ